MKDDTLIEHKLFECEHGHLFDENTKGKEYVVRCGTKIDTCPICGGELKEVLEEV